MISDLKNKTAFITGAAHGQGRATALALAKEGVNIMAFDIARTLTYPGYNLGSPEEMKSLVQDCESMGVRCLAFLGDVRSDEDINKAVQKGRAEFGTIDILFNNAGICAYARVHELTEKEWDDMLDINLKGAWMVARRIIPIMMGQRSGVIINNSSVAGLRGMNPVKSLCGVKMGTDRPY